MVLKKELLDILACPQCKGTLENRESEGKLVCGACRLAYEIKDDVPVMLVEEAKKI